MTYLELRRDCLEGAERCVRKAVFHRRLAIATTAMPYLCALGFPIWDIFREYESWGLLIFIVIWNTAFALWQLRIFLREYPEIAKAQQDFLAIRQDFLDCLYNYEARRQQP